MTKETMREMIADIVNNGAVYKYRVDIPSCKDGYEWHIYNLGEEVHFDYDYVKVEYWYVYKNIIGKPYAVTKNRLLQAAPVFKSESKQECDEWVKKESGTWFEKWQHNMLMSSKAFNFDAQKGSFLAINGFTKELLKRIDETFPDHVATGRNCLIYEIKTIISDMGVEL